MKPLDDQSEAIMLNKSAYTWPTLRTWGACLAKDPLLSRSIHTAK